MDLKSYALVKNTISDYLWSRIYEHHVYYGRKPEWVRLGRASYRKLCREVLPVVTRGSIVYTDVVTFAGVKIHECEDIDIMIELATPTAKKRRMVVNG